MSDYIGFGKIPRWNRDIVVTEKIDGTNAQIAICDGDNCDGLPCDSGATEYELGDSWRDPVIYAGSKNRWLSIQNDNFGFAAWVKENREELLKLGPGRHYGEWYGKGIGRGYGLQDRRFMLFNTARWSDPALRPSVCEVSTVLYEGNLKNWWPEHTEMLLRSRGSQHVPGFNNPEGLIIFHKASNSLFKVTLERDEEPKGKKA